MYAFFKIKILLKLNINMEKVMDNRHYGQKIKNIREIRNVTIEELSERSGISLKVITNIENGTYMPNLTPLIKIARVLGVRLGTFLDDEESIGPVVVRDGTKNYGIHFSEKENNGSTGLNFYSLAPSKSGRHMEPFVIDVLKDPSTEHQLSDHEGEEFLYVLSGAIEIYYGKDKYVLNKGDSIYYDSIIPHNVHAFGNDNAQILAVVYSPF